MIFGPSRSPAQLNPSATSITHCSSAGRTSTPLTFAPGVLGTIHSPHLQDSVSASPPYRLYFSPSKPAALPSCDHLHDVYLSPLSSALLSSQGGHVYGQRPANPPAPFAGPGSLYHQPLASHGLPLPATCGLLLNSALTAGG